MLSPSRNFSPSWNTWLMRPGRVEEGLRIDFEELTGEGAASWLTLPPRNSKGHLRWQHTDLLPRMVEPFYVGWQEVSKATSGSRGEGLASRLLLPAYLNAALVLQPFPNPPEVSGLVEDPVHTIFTVN